MTTTLLNSIGAASLITAVALATPLAAQSGSATTQQNAEASRYSITDLGPVGPTPGQPFHLTNNGLISGADTHSGSAQATLWYKRWKAYISTPGLGGANSIAFGVNQWGHAVGEADTTTADPMGEDFCGFTFLGLHSGTTCLPFVWRDGVMTALPTLEDRDGRHGSNGAANVINAWGEIAGLSENTTMDSTCPAHNPSIGQTQEMEAKPVIWNHGEIHELPTLGGDPDGVALAINDKGQTAGASGKCSPLNPATFLYIQPVHAILWEHGNAIDLGSLGGATGNIALGINNHGEVVGGSDVAGDTTSHGFAWTKEAGRMQDLPPFASDVFSTALAVNDRGGVVGVSADAKNNIRAVLWQHGVPIDLNSRMSDHSTFHLLLACSINTRGEIIGLAVDTATGNTHGYLAIPRHGEDH